MAGYERQRECQYILHRSWGVDRNNNLMGVRFVDKRQAPLSGVGHPTYPRARTLISRKPQIKGVNAVSPYVKGDK